MSAHFVMALIIGGCASIGHSPTVGDTGIGGAASAGRYVVVEEVGGSPRQVESLDEHTLVMATHAALQTVDIATRETVGTLRVGRPGFDGSIVDIATGRAPSQPFASDESVTSAASEPVDHVWVILDRTAVVMVDVRDRSRPTIAERRDAGDLGITPEHISAIDGRVFVSGRGGVIEWSTGERWPIDDDTPVGEVVMTMHGPAVSIQRQVRTLRHDQFLGAADELHAVAPPVRPNEQGEDQSAEATTSPLAHASSMRWLSLLRLSGGCEIALMGSDFRAIARHILPLHVSTVSMHPDGQHAWAAADDRIIPLRVTGDTLDVLQDASITLRGVRDVTHLLDGRAAACGHFGSAVIGDDHAVTLVTSGVGPFDHVRFDGRSVTASTKATHGEQSTTGSAQTWTYLPGSGLRAALLSATGNARMGEPAGWSTPRQQAAMLDVHAAISDGGTTLQVHAPTGTVAFDPPEDVTMHTVVACDGCWWIGHDRGVWVVDVRGDSFRLIQSILVSGPVRHICVGLDNRSAIAVGRDTMTLIRRSN